MFFKLENEIFDPNNSIDNEKVYFNFHKNRFKRFDNFLDNITINKPHIKKVLDIGSHYLHNSVLLSLRDFNVDSMDVSEFWNLDFVKNRSKKYDLNPIIENKLSELNTISNKNNHYDLIIFTEILEHITFNPINFWKIIYKVLKPGGIIYITTPNSIAMPNFIRKIKNIILLKSTGKSVDQIMSNLTYGHHWKEYSSYEIIKYFKLMSDDFDVKINPFYYVKYNLNFPNLTFKVLHNFGNFTKIFSSDLEVIVTLDKKTNWKIKSPDY